MRMRFLLVAPILTALAAPVGAASLLTNDELCDCCRAYEGACVPVCAKVVNFCRPESTRSVRNPLFDEDPWDGLEAVSFARTFGVFYLERLEKDRKNLEAFRRALERDHDKKRITFGQYRAGLAKYRAGLVKYNEGSSIYKRNR